ncbi:DUF6950 family protein [Shimia sp.]|uniref:DUF6950 family protein n=1 Tax=Shimia sp. TaxID=1954381 RepID=UPI003B8BDA1C
MNDLYRELHRWMAMPFDWTDANCAFCVADWIKQVRGVDPAAADRFTFADMASCQRATGFFSDPVGVFAERIEAAGLTRGNELKAGDVGILEVAGERTALAGVFTGSSWAFKGPNGTTTRRPDQVRVLAFWSVGYEP